MLTQTTVFSPPGAVDRLVLTDEQGNSSGPPDPPKPVPPSDPRGFTWFGMKDTYEFSVNPPPRYCYDYGPFIPVSLTKLIKRILGIKGDDEHD